MLTIFITGLLAGGLSCMAVQGGLLATAIAQTQEERIKKNIKTSNIFPLLAFLVSKLIAYTLLGLVLGSLGSVFQLTLQMKVFFQIAVSVFMLGTALSILNVHPLFRYFIIQPPKFLTRLIRKQSRNKHVFAPVVLGAFTIFIPCGTTQAMMALSISSGNALAAASILFFFTLGTSPIFFVLGYFATRLGILFQKYFMKIAAFAIILLAIFNINNAVSLTGSKFTLDNLMTNIWSVIAWQPNEIYQTEEENPVNEQTIIINPEGYKPDSFTVKKGTKVTIHLKNINGTNCVQTFAIPDLGIEQVVPVGQVKDISFTAPNKTGQIYFMCSMGMYKGIINVI